MTDVFPWFTWMIGSGGTFLVVLISFYVTFANRISKAEARAEAARDAATTTMLSIQGVNIKHENLEHTVNQHKVETASRIASLERMTETTSQALIAAETRLIRSMEDLGDKVDKLSESIIKTLGEMIARK